MAFDALMKLCKIQDVRAAARREDIIRFLKNHIEPYDDESNGVGYRASAYLTDGTYLPCVIFRNRKSRVENVHNVIKNTQVKKWYSSKSVSNLDKFIAEDIVVDCNQISFLDVDKVEKSKYAFPNSILKQIEGAVIGGAGFAAKMKDGKYVGFHSDSCTDHFFSMPNEYTVDDISEIILNGYVFENGQMRIIKYEGTETKNIDDAVFYEPHLYFNCYIDI